MQYFPFGLTSQIFSDYVMQHRNRQVTADNYMILSTNWLLNKTDGWLIGTKYYVISFECIISYMHYYIR